MPRFARSDEKESVIAMNEVKKQSLNRLNSRRYGLQCALWSLAMRVFKGSLLCLLAFSIIRQQTYGQNYCGQPMMPPQDNCRFPAPIQNTCPPPPMPPMACPPLPPPMPPPMMCAPPPLQPPMPPPPPACGYPISGTPMPPPSSTMGPQQSCPCGCGMPSNQYGRNNQYGKSRMGYGNRQPQRQRPYQQSSYQRQPFYQSQPVSDPGFKWADTCGFQCSIPDTNACDKDEKDDDNKDEKENEQKETDNTEKKPEKKPKVVKTNFTEVTDQTFGQNVINASDDDPVVVYFYQDDCPNCITMTPILNNIPKDILEDFTMVQINGPKNPVTTQKYNITGFPTFVIFDDKKEKKKNSRRIGAMASKAFYKWLDEEAD